MIKLFEEFINEAKTEWQKIHDNINKRDMELKKLCKDYKISIDISDTDKCVQINDCITNKPVEVYHFNKGEEMTYQNIKNVLTGNIADDRQRDFSNWCDEVGKILKKNDFVIYNNSKDTQRFTYMKPANPEFESAGSHIYTMAYIVCDK
jgi:hypothetical protein